MAFRPVAQPGAKAQRFRVIAAPEAQRAPTLADDITGALATFNRSFPLADEFADAVAAGADLMTGRAKSPGAAWKAARARSKALVDDFGTRAPVRANLAKGFGLAAQAVPAVATGGVSVVPTAAKGVLPAVARAVEPSARAAVAAGLAAQASGLASEGTAQERVRAANEATVPAMTVGAVLPPALAAAGAARRAAARLAAGTGKGAARIANRATGGKLLDPETEAAKRLGEALKADGLGPQEVRRALEEWQTTGASSPALLNLAGENTKALLRAAAAKPGAARNRAVGLVNEVEADLQPNAIRRTRALTPNETRSAGQLAKALEERQGAVADEMYPGPYAEPATVTPKVMEALADEPGKAALRRARAAAVARRNPQQVAEIDALLNADGPLDMSHAARMARANELGFTVDAYHGTPHGFADDLDIARSGSNTGEHSRGAIFASSSPANAATYTKLGYADENTLADHYRTYDRLLKIIEEKGYGPKAYASAAAERDEVAAEILEQIERQKTGPNIRPLRINPKDFPQHDAGGQFWYDHNAGAVTSARQAGAPGATIRNVIDTGPLGGKESWIPQDTYAVFDPARVRSRFDAFEPEGYQPPPEVVSGGALDRIRIAMGGRARKMQQSPDTKDIAGGLFSREADIDAALDAVPGLAPARATYRGIQVQRDAVNLGAENAMARPDDFADELDALLAKATPDDNPFPVTERDILGAAQSGLRSDLETRIGAPAENATGLLNRVATGTNARRVLEDTYGLEDASLYRDAIQREIDKVADARFISPNSGSKTANVLLDQLIEPPAIPTTPLGALRIAIDKVQRGLSLTEAERAALMDLGTRRIESADAIPSIPAPTSPIKSSPAQRQQIAQGLALEEGARQGQAQRRGVAVEHNGYLVYADGTIEPIPEPAF